MVFISFISFILFFYLCGGEGGDREFDQFWLSTIRCCPEECHRVYVPRFGVIVLLECGPVFAR